MARTQRRNARRKETPGSGFVSRIDQPGHGFSTGEKGRRRNEIGNQTTKELTITVSGQAATGKTTIAHAIQQWLAGLPTYTERPLAKTMQTDIRKALGLHNPLEA